MRRLVAGAALFAMVAALLAAPVHAGWLSRIAREAAETGGGAGLSGRAGRLGIATLDDAAAYVATLPKLAKGTPLAAHVTPEGHWKFVNRDGEVFTAASPDELARVRSTLAPAAAADEPLAFYLSEDTVFARRAALKELPDAELRLVVGRETFRLRELEGAGELVAEFRSGLVVSLQDRTLFTEAIDRLGRSINRASIRVLALEPGSAGRLSTVPRYDPVTKAALVDPVDPSTLPRAVASLKGQSALITGRIDGTTLTYKPAAGGGERTLDLVTLIKAAEEADVNLILLGGRSTHQPGGRNWLWQKVAVAGLDEAMTRATFADFLSALGGNSGELLIRPSSGSQGRVVISAAPTPGSASPLTETLGGWLSWDTWIGDITGHVAVNSVQLLTRDAAAEKEREARIIPGIPSAVQYGYLASLLLGLLSIPVSLGWWSRLWPHEERSEYSGRIGFWAARTVRLLAYVLVFLPLVSGPAFIWGTLLYIWGVLSAPARGWAWLRNRISPRRA